DASSMALDLSIDAAALDVDDEDSTVDLPTESFASGTDRTASELDPADAVAMDDTRSPNETRHDVVDATTMLDIESSDLDVTRFASNPRLDDLTDALPSAVQVDVEALDIETAMLEESGDTPRTEREDVALAEAESDVRAPFESDESPSALETSPEALVAIETDVPDASTTLAALDIPDVATDLDDVVFDLVLDDERLATDIDLPMEILADVDPYAQRDPETREQMLERLGGTKETEQAVQDALRWLARHQSRDGHWSASQFDDDCGMCGGESSISADKALTGLALLCFLAADHTHVEDGPYRDTVARGLAWLVEQQRTNGDLRRRETMYTQGIATIALAEAYGMTKDDRLRLPLERAVGFIVDARSEDGGGWRYDPGQAGDTSVLGWQVMALKSAQRAGMNVPESAFEHARAFLEMVAHPRRRGQYAYQPGEQPTHSMTAEGMFVQQLLGAQREDPRMKQSAGFLTTNLPGWKREAPTYYWYYGTLALFQHRGPEWEMWNTELVRELVGAQRQGGRVHGSWDPSDRWSRVGGRVYQTAICTLTLETYYRYLPLYIVTDE
ncbi:MAG: terpene cyclase/mutase family protein, partial [Phycisphaerales bacterium]|nr:terpene cyclase/mutase family protein [Phycisphaerales bacterium]